METKIASRFEQSFLSAKVGIIIVALSFLPGIAAASPAGAHADSAADVPIAAVQGRPALPDLFSGAPGGGAESKAIEIDQITSLRSGFAERLESWGLLSPKHAITLNLNEDALKDMPEIESVRWEFSQAYYFLDKEVPGKSIKVVAWHPFLAKAKVKFKGVADFYTYSSWVDVGKIN